MKITQSVMRNGELPIYTKKKNEVAILFDPQDSRQIMDVVKTRFMIPYYHISEKPTAAWLEKMESLGYTQGIALTMEEPGQAPRFGAAAIKTELPNIKG